ncbi:MAG: cysteine--tRNA ligase [bacterium]
MELKLFNTLTRRKEEFKPLKNKTVGLYTCGPTVYWYQHIGNLRSYIFADLLKRVLLFNDYKVKHVMNVTDVGHLTSDTDEGEDKMEMAAKKEGKKASEIADFYWRIFKQDFKKLNIIEPNIWCKATEHIKEQIEMVKKLEKNGYAYRTSDGIYFDTAKFKDYNKMTNPPAGGEGARVEKNPEKKNPSDFALWKFSEKPGQRQQEWQSPWGLGFPGWHIECSAMSSKYLGEQFDIHTGGEDHIAIHHPNEIAQSEAAFGKKPWVRYWLHGAFLTFKGEKVSKSKGGLYTVSELAEQSFDPLAYRYLCLMTHYRKPLSFSLASLKAAQEGLNNLRRELPDDKGKVIKKYLDDFIAAVNDDLNLPKALGVLQKVVKLKDTGRRVTINEFDKVLGLGLNEVKQVKIPKEILKLVKERETARQEKNWQKADELRKEIEGLGYAVEDSAGGSQIVKK